MMLYVSHYTEAERRAHGRKLAKAHAAAVEAERVAQILARAAHAEGVPTGQIAEELGVERATIRKWVP